MVSEKELKNFIYLLLDKRIVEPNGRFTQKAIQHLKDNLNGRYTFYGIYSSDGELKLNKSIDNISYIFLDSTNRYLPNEIDGWKQKNIAYVTAEDLNAYRKFFGIDDSALEKEYAASLIDADDDNFEI